MQTYTFNPKQPTIVTSADQPVAFGAAIADSATLGNTANKPNGDPAGFFFNDTATTEIYTLSLHDALPICAAFPVTGNGTYGPASFTPTTVGVYRWIATYS